MSLVIAQVTTENVKGVEEKLSLLYTLPVFVVIQAIKQRRDLVLFWFKCKYTGISLNFCVNITLPSLFV